MARSRMLMARSLFSTLRAASRPGAPSLGERGAAVPRLVRATTSGAYRGTTVARLGMIAAAVAYVISPVDLMPEGLLSVFGLADDALVLSWLAAAFLRESEDFLAWERSAPAATAGTSFPDTGTPGQGVPMPQSYPSTGYPSTGYPATGPGYGAHGYAPHGRGPSFGPTPQDRR